MCTTSAKKDVAQEVRAFALLTPTLPPHRGQFGQQYLALVGFENPASLFQARLLQSFANHNCACGCNPSIQFEPKAMVMGSLVQAPRRAETMRKAALLHDDNKY